MTHRRIALLVPAGVRFDRRLLGFGLLGIGFGLAGCGSSTNSPGTSTQPQIAIVGAGQVRLGSTAQLSASVTNESNTAVTWQVNGVTGGAAATGTISTNGLYTPPTTIPATNPITITAISVAAPTLTTSASETVWNPTPSVTSATVSQNYGATSGLLTVTGTGFVSGAQIQAGGVAVTTTYVSSTSLQATVPVASGATSISVAVVNPNPGSATSIAASAAVQASLQSAARLLDQATFGPTLAGIQTVQNEGLPAYLTAQFALPATIEPDIAATPPTLCATNTIPCQQAEWWQAAITAPDQLRQRVALALSEMFVVSTNSVNARSIITYQNMLATDAFSNFLTIMHDVALSPAMGGYLNMLNSAKPGTINGVPQIANENFARENMQLFTVGLGLLNQDGTLQLDPSGNPIPTYTEAQVQAFARVYTGWTYATATGGSPTSYPNNTANYDYPMAPVETQHDMTAKTLLNGVTLPAGQTAEADLSGGLSNIFNHPNVGPFVCRQLIQHLLSSNPSPAYVSRVAAVFADDGSASHVRGNMQAVLKAILLDTEARAGDANPSYDGGHLREPLLYMANVIRGLGATFTPATGQGAEYYSTLSNYTSALSEKPYTSGSVFNFFPPNYVIPATVSNRQITPQWSILDASYTTTPGTLTPISGSPDSILYTAPPTPPIYTQTPTGLTQGVVTVDVAVSDPSSTTSLTVPDSISVVVTSPSVAVDLTPSTANVALGGTAQFFGYALGSTNNSVTWQVNGQPGGSTSTGTISSAGTYIAPANLPMSGNTVTVTVISLADPTKSASAAVTLH